MSKLLKVILSVTIILCPLYILRAKVLIPTTLLEWLIGASVLVVLIYFLKSKEKVAVFKSSFDKLILGFILVAILETVLSANFIGGLGILKAYFIEPVLLYYCLIYLFKKSDGSFIITSLLITALWLSILGLIQGLTGKFSLAPNEIVQGRVSAVYNSANSLALFIGPLIGLAVALFLKQKGKARLIYFGLTLILILIIIWTRSRGGVIAEVFSLLVLIYALLSQKILTLKKIWYVVPIIIIGLISLTLFQTIRGYSSVSSQVTTYHGSDTLEIRYYLWQGTENMLIDHPIFGAGLDGFKTLYSQRYKLPQYPEDFQYPHNFILTFWAETGIFGLLIFLAILVRAFKILLTNLKKEKNTLLSAGLLAALTYIIIHGVVDVPYFKNDLSLEFWVLLALIEVSPFKTFKTLSS